MSYVDLETGEMSEKPKPQKSERFTKSITEVWRHVIKANLFTGAEERILHRLSNWLQLNTNAIVTPGGEYMSIEDMARQLGMDRVHMRRTIKSLMQKNAVGMWKSGDVEAYYINPFLYQCGEISPYLFWLFDREYHDRCKKEHLRRFKAGKKYTSLAQA